MKVAIFSAGNEGKKVYEVLKEIKTLDIVCFVDNNANLLGKERCNIGIISPYLLKKKLDMGELDTVLIPSTRMISYGLEEFVNQLEKLGIRNYKIVPAYYLRKHELDVADYKKLEDMILNKELTKINQLQHLQFHIMDKCNLNCKRCQHFSNLVDTDELANFTGISNDLERLRTLFDNINVIAILGGEPLLNPELEKYCHMVREKFPYSIIEIITNGLLIKNMSDSLVQAILENNITINISYYPVLTGVIDETVAFLQKKGIKYIIGSSISTFSKKMCLENVEDVDIDKNFKMCRDRCCTTLRDGKLYPCYLPATIRYFNQKFNRQIDGDKSSINIYDDNITGWDILERLKKGFDICRYCTKEEMYMWEQSKVVEERDWIV